MIISIQLTVNSYRRLYPTSGRRGPQPGGPGAKGLFSDALAVPSRIRGGKIVGNRGVHRSVGGSGVLLGKRLSLVVRGIKKESRGWQHNVFHFVVDSPKSRRGGIDRLGFH